ncbi:MAG: ribosomal subunit interface protein, partial [Phenylobacterium zucineum]
MELNISAKNLSVSDRFREYVAERAAKVEQLAHRVDSIAIKVTRYDHNRHAGTEDRVELTVHEPGHVIRAEAQADDKFAAFDAAFGKLLERLRRASDRRKVHHGRHSSAGASELSASDFAALDITPASAELLTGPIQVDSANRASDVDLEDFDTEAAQSPIVIRRKQFDSNPMTVDDALYHME